MLRWMTAPLIAIATISGAQAQEMLANLHIVGTVERTGKAPAFKVGDVIKVVEDKGGAIAATGTILDAKGTFFVEMSKSAHYNGTPLHFDIVVQGEQFALKEGKAEAKMAYKGGFPFPKRETRQFYYGDGVPGAPVPQAAMATGKGTAVCPSSLPKCDANGDGVFDQQDTDFVKAQLTAKNPDPRADLNGDGTVNSADLVAGVRELNNKH